MYTMNGDCAVVAVMDAAALDVRSFYIAHQVKVKCIPSQPERLPHVCHLNHRQSSLDRLMTRAVKEDMATELVAR